MSTSETQSLTSLPVPLGELPYHQVDILLHSVSFRMRTIGRFTSEYKACEELCRFLRDRIHKVQNGGGV